MAYFVNTYGAEPTAQSNRLKVLDRFLSSDINSVCERFFFLNMGGVSAVAFNTDGTVCRPMTCLEIHAAVKCMLTLLQVLTPCLCSELFGTLLHNLWKFCTYKA